MDSRLSKVIDMIRSRRGDLQESPTMSAGAGGFTGSAASTGPVAGYDPVLNIIDRRKKKNKNYPKGYVSMYRALMKGKNIYNAVKNV